MLPVPAANGLVNYVEWAEDEDPYAAALSAIFMTVPHQSNQKLFVDNSIRKIIVDGLYEASTSPTAANFDNSRQHLLANSNTLSTVDLNKHKHIHIQSAPPQIMEMREQKSRNELEILQCVNEVRANDLLNLLDISSLLYAALFHTSFPSYIVPVATIHSLNSALERNSSPGDTVISSLLGMSYSISFHLLHIVPTIALMYPISGRWKWHTLSHGIRAGPRICYPFGLNLSLNKHTFSC